MYYTIYKLYISILFSFSLSWEEERLFISGNEDTNVISNEWICNLQL
jgi:hypothetical protein